MNYKYRKGQIFGKRLKVPKNVLYGIYNCSLTFEEYIKYQLDDKIPVTCIRKSDREIVEKFGIEKCKKLDWELINKNIYYLYNINFREILMSIDSQTEDVNVALYELIKDRLVPGDYSTNMRKVYSNRLFQSSEREDDENLKNVISSYNSGRLNLEKIILNWELLKNKELSYFLLNDISNKTHITVDMLHEFMDNYGDLVSLVIKNRNVYSFISDVLALNSEEKRCQFIKKFTDEVLSNTYGISSDYRPSIVLTNDEYKAAFKYSSLEDYLMTRISNKDEANHLVQQLNLLPKDYIFNMPFSCSKFLENEILTLAYYCGLENVVDFDNECEHFFTKNNNKMLDKIALCVGSFASASTKDDFYDLVAEIIISHSFSGFSDYRNLGGEFRRRYPELFISDQAPQELQNIFYSKSLTPKLLEIHPEYLEYLRGKNLSSCFKRREIFVGDRKVVNLYSFLSDKMDFNDLLNFVIEYNDVFDAVFDEKVLVDIEYKLTFPLNCDLNQIKDILYDFLRKVIIEKRIPYPKHIPEEFIRKYPSMFLEKSTPQELKEAFYNRTISLDFILSHPSYRKYIENVDLEVAFGYMPVTLMSKSSTNEAAYSKLSGYLINYNKINFINALKLTYTKQESLDIMLLYGKYIDEVYQTNKLSNFLYNPEFTKSDFLDQLDMAILKNILDGNMKYDENIPSHFKNNNPTLFLDNNVSPVIKDKFYNRQFTLKDFEDNPDLLNIFNDTNVACGFSKKFAWVISLFTNLDNKQNANSYRLKIISEYSKIEDTNLQKIFKEVLIEMGDEIDIEKVKYISEVLARLSNSNSSEIYTFRRQLAQQLLKTNDPLENLNKIEEVFTKNNIPTVGKIYSCFEILHPDFYGFSFNNSKVSPVLKRSSTSVKKIVVFSDLIRSAFGSNNKSVNSYLKNMEIGSNLYKDLKSGKIQIDSLTDSEKNELTIFCNHLIALYNNTMESKKESKVFVSNGNILDDISKLTELLLSDKSDEQDLTDKIVRMFCGFAGFDTLEQAKKYIDTKVKMADSRNRQTASSNITLEKGDFIKGLGGMGITYLRNILQNGSVSKEYLGSCSDSDATPLDTDLSMITISNGTISDKIRATQSSSYGPIWFVLKNDDKFLLTRTEEADYDAKRDLSKLELFYTGVLGAGHYGIRTGFASSEINYIIVEKYDPRIGLEIAMNGFYIPVIDMEGKIVFAPKDYDKLRMKMSGLSYFDEENYIFSDNLVTEETEYLAHQIAQSNNEVRIKKNKIISIIRGAIEELGLHLKTSINGDLTEGYVELIDTGSTGRGTNRPGDGDFDFMIRLDRSILLNASRLNELKQTILKRIDKNGTLVTTGAGDFRLKNVQIDDNTSVDLDITFAARTDKVSYSTDMALQDKLNTIQKISPEKYEYVIANILLAKQVLKDAQVYKPDRGESPQGGLGGVGIENWILQSGGSFIDAAKDFIECAEGKSFSEFASTYQIWDFGENHLAEKRGKYPHDNFVANNMSELGYEKMVQVLKEYLKNLKINQSHTFEVIK